MGMTESMGSIRDRVIDENIRLHAEQARIYRLLNPQLYNSYHRRRLCREVDFILCQLAYDQVPEVRILDLGCGTGFLSSHFLRADNCNVTAMDISTEMLDIFRASITDGQGKRLKLVNGEAMEFVLDSLAKGVSYDAVVMSALLHHLVDVGEFVRSSCQLVRPGGFFYVAFEPLKQEIKSKSRYFWHRTIRSLDETSFHVYLRLKKLKPEEKGMADYQLAFGGIEPSSVVNSLGDGFEVISLNKFCVRRSGILAFISDSIVRSENTFSLIARRRA